MNIAQNKKFRITIALLVCLLVGAFVYAFIAWRTDDSLNFQASSPTALPDGIELKGHTTSVISGENRKYKQVTLLTNSDNFTIGEQKSTPEEFAKTLYSCASKIENSPCTDLKSPHGQVYSVRSSYDRQNVAFNQTISWHTGGTRFWIALTKDQVQKYSDESWGDIIDSFAPADYGFEPDQFILG